MKYRFFLLTLVFIFLNGCAARSNSRGISTNTPLIMPRLNPSPTPSDSTLPLTCQVTDLNVYINEVDGYCFAYPGQFTLGAHPSDTSEVRGPAIDNSSEPVHATFGVEVTTTGKDRTVREQAEIYLKEFSAADPASFIWTQIQVDGEEAWNVEPIPTHLAYRIIFVQHNGTLFRLMYWPVNLPAVQSDLNDLMQTTLGSFAFTK